MNRIGFLKRLALGTLAIPSAITAIANIPPKTKQEITQEKWYDEINNVHYPYNITLYDPKTFIPIVKRIYKNKITGKVSITIV